MISLGLFLLIKNQEQDENEKSSFKAEKLFQAGQYTEAINIYRQMSNISASNLLVYGKALALNGEHRKAVAILERAKKQLSEPFLCNNLGISYQALKEYKRAEENFKLSHQMIPNLIYPKYLLAKLYIEEGKVSKARKQAIEVINSPIKVYSEAAEEMKEELRIYLSQNTGK
ncbi:tetratricopeptide repeat protein [Flectobacillus longus]|uniref:tetratricopeptide repeat protein n=1 Tax=Flectobacillus longus TaxID=2984207 RepID=UPI0024B84AAB|nr:tetratricopeptide repeat protein [Flectobacillus longus]MDI9877792.1 tetratricopeptide repeat protein [Flectobacillus longus]